MASGKIKKPKTPTDRWKDRFHRDVNFDLLKDGRHSQLSVYITRPTFEKLRSSKKSEDTFNAIKEVLESLNIRHSDVANIVDREIPWIGIYDNDKTFFSAIHKFERDESALEMYSIISGPYNVDKEMSGASNAVLIDIYEGSKFDLKTEERININRYLNKDSICKLDSSGDLINVYQNMVKELIVDTRGIEQLSFDLTAARLFPTEFMLLRSPNHHAFKKMLLQQFNEIRLIDDMTKVNYEQVSAINRFNINESPMQNLSGRPGTGKSTIQHILVCEFLLQPGIQRGERNILYLATTQALLDEAREEIKSILQNVYGRTKLVSNKLIKNIQFITEENLFLISPGIHRKLDRDNLREIIQKIGNEISKKESDYWKYWLKDANASELYRILDVFVYGVFGSPSKFSEWLGNSKSNQEIYDLFTTPINLVKPDEKSVAQISPIYYWNPFAKNPSEKEISEGCKKIKSLTNLIFNHGGLMKYLQDYENENDGLWTPSGLIYSSAREVEEFIKNENLNQAWKIAIDTGYDCIFMDESQDFSAITISVLLEHFSNRNQRNGHSRRPFSFISTGDEYQTIRGNLFQGNMLHINNMYQDWKEWLITISSDSTYTLADGLMNPSRNSLVANYRNFDIAVRIVNKIVEWMYEIGKKNMPNLRRGVKANVADVQRKGYLASSFCTDKDGNNDESSKPSWGAVIERLAKQTRDNSEDIKVAMIIPQQEELNVDTIVDHLDKVSKTQVLPSESKEHLEEIKTNVKRAIDAGADSSVFSEYGIFDVESIKGLTVPVVITFYEDINQLENDWEKMQKLSHILVAVSRTQFGLFIVTDSLDDYYQITGEETVFSNSIDTDIDDDAADAFRTMMLNMTTSEIPESALFLQAINSAYSKTKWERILNKTKQMDKNAKYLKFLNNLSEILQAIRLRPSPERVEKILHLINELGNEFNKSKNEIDFHLNGEYITEHNGKNIKLLSFYIYNNLLARISYDDSEIEEMFEEIFENVQDDWDYYLDRQDDNQSNFAKTIMSPNQQTYVWLNLLFSRKKFDSQYLSKLIDYDLNPWSENNLNLTPVEYPRNGSLPRVKISPWKFPKPNDESIEKFEPWMSEEAYWTIPPKLILDIIEKSGLDRTNKNAIKWLTLVIEKNSEELLQVLLSGNEEENLLAINWLFCILSHYKENIGLRDYGIENDLLQSLSDKVCSDNDVRDLIAKLIREYNTIEEIELAFGVIVSLSGKNNHVKNRFDMLELSKYWLGLYLRQRTKLNQVHENVVEFIGLANARYAEGMKQINTLLNIQPATRKRTRKAARKRTRNDIRDEYKAGLDKVLEINEKETFSGNEREISESIVLEKILNLDTAIFNPVSDNDVAKEFSKLLLEILEPIFDQMFIHQPYSEDLIELIFQGADRRMGLDNAYDVKYIKRIADKLKWILSNFNPQYDDGEISKNSIYGSVLDLNRNIRDRALDSLTSNLLFRRKRIENRGQNKTRKNKSKMKKPQPGKNKDKINEYTTQSEIFSKKSILSELVQISWPNSHWSTKSPNSWSWRTRGHTFWNNTTLGRDFDKLDAVERFNPNKEFNPQLYVNSLTLKGLIDLHELLHNVEALESEPKDPDGSRGYIVDRELVNTSKYFLEGGDAKSSSQVIILEQLLSPIPELNRLIMSFAEAILSEPAIYHAHLIDRVTEITEYGTPVPPKLKSKYNKTQYIVPKTIVNDDILTRFKCNIREIDSRLSQSELQRTYDDNVPILQYFSIDYSGQFIDDDNEIDKRIGRMNKNIGMNLKKHFANMKTYQELMLLSRTLMDISNDVKFESVKQFRDWMKEMLSQEYEIETFIQGTNPLEAGAQIYRNAGKEYLIEGHTVISKVNFSSKRFSKYFRLLNDILSKWNNGNITLNEIKDIFFDNFNKNSIFEVTGLSGGKGNREHTKRKTTQSNELKEKFDHANEKVDQKSDLSEDPDLSKAEQQRLLEELKQLRKKVSDLEKEEE